MKISFSTTDDSIEQVLAVIKAVYGVEVTLGEPAGSAQTRELEPVVADSDAVQELGSVPEPEAASPADEPVAEPAEQAVAAKRTRSRSAAKPVSQGAAVTSEGTKAAPAKRAVAKKATKKAPANKPTVKKVAAKSADTSPPGQGKKARRSATTPAGAPKASKPEAKLVRAWAREQGLESVPSRGMLPARMYEQYAVAHA